MGRRKKNPGKGRALNGTRGLGRRQKSLKSRRQELIEKGEKFSRKELLLCYGGVLLICILLGRGMKLGMGYQLTGISLCLLQVPGMYYHGRKRMYEKKRFDYANAYISHMTQSFAGSGKILLALRETKTIFASGTMEQILTRAVLRIENAYDVELAEGEALGLVTGEYDCERVRTLHDFIRKAESRGGSCEEEFRLLESIRQLWEQSALKYQNTIFMARNLVTFEYFLLVLVCMFMLRQFPEDLEIIHLPLVQGLNTFLIVCFFLVFSMMDKRLSGSMLKDGRRMTETEAKNRLAYIRQFRQKGSMILKTLSGGYLRYFYNVQVIKSEIRNVFPGWLFDVLLLMQSENVSVAIFKSMEKAPAVLREDLKQMKQELEENPQSPEAFLSFLAEFQLTEVEGIMRKLYALNNGTGVRQEVMNLIIDTNMTMLAEAEKQKLRLKGDLYSVCYMIPTVPVMVCMVGYGAALMFMIFQNIMTMI